MYEIVVKNGLGEIHKVTYTDIREYGRELDIIKKFNDGESCTILKPKIDITVKRR